MNPFEGGFGRPDTGRNTIYLGETAQIRLRVENISRQDITNVEVVSVAMHETPFGGDVEITQTANDLPSTLTPSGDDSRGFIWLDVTELETGQVWLTADVRGVRDNKTVTTKIETLFMLKGGLSLTVEQANNIVLGADNNGDGEIDDDDEIVELTVKVENETEEPVTDIGPIDLTKPLRLTSRIAGLAVALIPKELPTEKIAELAAGESRTLTYKYRAFDKVAADIDVVFQGMQDSREVSGVGSSRVAGDHEAMHRGLVT